MSKSKKQQVNDRLWRVIMFPLGAAASNAHFMLFIAFFMVYATEYLGLNPITVGLIMTGTRILDAITDPIIGSLIDRTETKYGKFRPFLISGSIVLNISLFMIFTGIRFESETTTLIWVTIWYIIWVIGYTMMTTVNKSGVAVVTKDPKKRPVSGMAGGIYSMLLGLGIFVATVPIIMSQGGFQVATGWRMVAISIIIVNIIFTSLSVFAISAQDKSENFAKEEAYKKFKIKDYLSAIKGNRPLQMLIAAASTNKLADTVASASMVYFYMYTIQNVELQSTVSGLSMPLGFIGVFIAGSIAIKFGLKKAFVLGSWLNIMVSSIIIILRPFGTNMLIIYIILVALNTIFRRLTAQNIDPMIADIVDYQQYKEGKFMPGIIGATFSFVDKFISSFGSTIVGVFMGLAGYSAGVEPTTPLYWTAMLLFLGMPILGDICSVIAMKYYSIDKNFYKKMYKEKAAS